MNMKAMQILLLVAGVLCAVGVIVAFSSDKVDKTDLPPPPKWLQSFDFMAGGPQLARRELTRNGQGAFPAALRLNSHDSVTFTVSRSSEKTRRVTFLIDKKHQRIRIEYRPALDQSFEGENAVDQTWPNEDSNWTDDPSFITYNGGGTFKFENDSNRRISIRMEP